MLVVAVAALAVQLAAWAWVAAGLRRVREAQPAAQPPAQPEDGAASPLPLSIVVAAHDEEKNIPALLDALERQDHRPLEVVVVDDRSTDATAALVEARAAAWAASAGPPLRLVRVAEGEPDAAGLPPKKHALARGLAAARHDRVVMTDADCTPPPTWLRSIAHHAAPAGTDEGAVLVGYGPYRRVPGALNLFVRYETLLTAALTAAAVGHGRPYMAVGRNFSYLRGLVAEVGGFDAATLSGDDDLLVQAAARAGATVRYVLEPAAFVESAAPSTAGAWVRQKRRHASAGRRYPVAVLVGLGAFHASALALWLAPFLLGWTGAALLAVRLLVQRAALRPAFSEFDARDLSFPQPLLDAAYALYAVAFAALGALPAPRRW